MRAGFSIDGWNGSGLTSVFYIATVAGDGSLETWSTGTALPQSLYLQREPLAIPISSSVAATTYVEFSRAFIPWPCLRRPCCRRW